MLRDEPPGLVDRGQCRLGGAAEIK